MAMDATEDYSVPDPQDVLAAQAGQYRKEQESGTGSERALSNIRFGLQQFAGGGPEVQRAQNVKERFSAIMQGVSAHEDPNEDPITSQIRLAHALSTGMIDVAPHVAMQANEQLIKLQQAKQQQALLQAQTQHAQAETKKENFQQGLNEKLGQVVFARQGDPDEKGLPTGLVSMGTLDPSDPDYAQKVAELQAEAAKQGHQVVPMLAKDFVNSKDQLAMMRGQYNLAAAQERANATIQAAALRAQAQGSKMDSRTMGRITNLLNGAVNGAADLKNIVELPYGSNTGIFGIGQVPGHSILQATTDDLRNRLSSQEVMNYNTSIAGLQRSLAFIENSGYMPNATFTKSMDSIVARDGDTQSVMLHKLAQIRQIMEQGTKVTLANPNIPDEMKEQVTAALEEAKQAVPFTFHDVTMLDKAKKGTTIKDIIDQKMSGKEEGAAPELPPQAIAALKEGHETTFTNGQTWTLENGKPKKVR